MWERFTERAKQAVFSAQNEAAIFGVAEVSPEHLLLGLLVEKKNIAVQALQVFSVDTALVESEVRIWEESDAIPKELKLSERGKRVIDLSYAEARTQRIVQINTGSLLLGILREGGAAAQVLRKHGLIPERLRGAIQDASEE